MLIDIELDPKLVSDCEAFSLTAPKRFCQGIYLVEFDLDLFLDFDSKKTSRRWDPYPFSDSLFAAEGPTKAPLVESYGSCDSLEQFLKLAGDHLDASKSEYLVSLKFFTKQDHGDYRFHKNGPYLGTLREGFEHFRDEPRMHELWQFHVYERLRHDQLEGQVRAQITMRERLGASFESSIN